MLTLELDCQVSRGEIKLKQTENTNPHYGFVSFAYVLGGLSECEVRRKVWGTPRRSGEPDDDKFS